MSDPWMKFYPQDWRADEKLRMCSLAARGLWLEMLAIMHRSERYGQLLISGRVPTDEQLAVQVGASPSEVTALLAELDGAGVFSRTSNRSIYSRRMTRDHKKAENARKNGRNGGNPNLMPSDGKTKGKSTPVKGSDKGGLKGEDKPQIPEARYQKEEPPNPQAIDPPRSESLAKVMEAAGMSREPADWQPHFDRWHKAGASLDDDVIPVVKRVTGELMATSGRRPFTMKVFDAAVHRHLDEARQAVEARSASVARTRQVERDGERERQKALADLDAIIADRESAGMPVAGLLKQREELL